MEKTQLPGLLLGNSHPGKKLEEHLNGVKEIMIEIDKWHGLCLDKEDIEKIALTHDLGKEHKDFQQRLKNPKVRFSHAGPSSFFTYLHTKDILDTEIVRNHHGDFNNIEQVQSFWNSKDIEDFNDTINKIIPGNSLEEKELDFIKCSILMDKWDQNKWIQSRMKASLLITADRMDAMGITQIKFDIPKRIKTYEEIIKEFPKNQIGKWREENAKEAFQKLKTVKKGETITLSLPTGAGKTLIGLEAASRLKPKTIIYALPFITIVDQVAGISKNIFEKIQQDHYLSESENEFVQAFRYWMEPVIITTFAHLWDVLYSPHMNDTMNFHRLKDAVVILDEIQSIPANYWKGLGHTLKFISEKLGTTFILMTATQPKITNGNELSRKTEPPFKSRYTIKRTSIKSIEELTEFAPEKGSGLILLNTKKSALITYEKMKEKTKKKIFFLSRWVAPVYRKEKICEVIKSLKNGEECLLISTQIIEAGIDLDFDWVIRDIAPLDNIIQASGRCNRNHRIPEGKVWITELVSEKDRSYSKQIYDTTLLTASSSILPEKTEESEVKELLEKYYKKLEDSINQKGPWYDIIEGKWGNRHPLIKVYIPQAMALVDYEGKIKIKFEELLQIPKTLKTLDKRKKFWNYLQQYSIEVPGEEMKEWINQTNSFMINNETPSIEEIQTGIYLIQGKGIGTIYLPECGFNISKKTEDTSSEEGW